MNPQLKDIWLIYVNTKPLMVATVTAGGKKEDVLAQIRAAFLGKNIDFDAKPVSEATDRDLAEASLALGVQVQAMLAMAMGGPPQH